MPSSASSKQLLRNGSTHSSALVLALSGNKIGNNGVGFFDMAFVHPPCCHVMSKVSNQNRGGNLYNKARDGRTKQPHRKQLVIPSMNGDLPRLQCVERMFPRGLHRPWARKIGCLDVCFADMARRTSRTTLVFVTRKSATTAAQDVLISLKVER